MKYDYLTFSLYLILLGSIFSPAHSQEILWEKSYGGKQGEYLLDTQPTADYGFILAGSSVSNNTGNKSEKNNGDLDYWVWKMDENGELDWQKTIGGSGNDLLTSIKNTLDGGFILAGTSSSNADFQKKEDCKGVTDYWVIKLDAQGNEEWQKTMGGSGQEELVCVNQTRDGGYILGGSSSSNPIPIDPQGETQEDNSIKNLKPDLYAKSEKSRGNMDYWIVKLDKIGNIQWQKTYGGIYADMLGSMEQTKDGGYILGGSSNSPQSGDKADDSRGIGDFWIIKINDEGTIEWQKTCGGNEDEQLYGIHQTQDGGYIAGGNSNSTDTLTSLGGRVSNGADYWIFKLDSKGAFIWSKTYDFGTLDILTSLIENNDHTYLIGGYSPQSLMEESKNETTKTPEGINDYISLIISENGEVLSNLTVGSNGEDILKKLIETRDGGYLMTGSSNPQSNTPNSTAKKMRDGNQNESFQNAINEANNTINDANRAVNTAIKDELTNTTNFLNKASNKVPDSRFKLGFNTPTGELNLPSLGSGNDSKTAKQSNKANEQNQKKLPASRDKKTNYGGTDFWVVKLKDKSKPKVIKATIEVYPNPVVTFTNVIIGYEFEKGTATVVDMLGRTLQKFDITSRTVPVDLSNYPDGVYVVNIKTNVQTDGVKLIKSSNK